MKEIRFNYFEKENKEVILFLHGWGGNEFSFNNAINLLKNSYSILSINLMDISSNYLNKSLTIYDFAIKVFEILHNLNIKRCHIICHSFGFRIALILNRIFDFKIDSFVICDGAGINNFSFIKSFKIFSYKFIKKLCNLKLCNKKILSKFGSDDYKNLDNNMKQTFINIVNYNLKSYVKFINQKTTIIWGKYDDVTKINIAKFLKRKIINSKLKIYNSNHFAYLNKNFDFLCDLEEHFNLI